MFETLLYEKTDAVARITLNRPEVMNIHNMAMRDDLYALLSAVREDDVEPCCDERPAGWLADSEYADRASIDHISHSNSLRRQYSKRRLCARGRL